MKTYDFTKIKLIDLDGVQVDEAKEEREKDRIPVYKLLAILLFRHASNYDLIDTAREINKGCPVQLKPAEVKEIRALIKSPNSRIFSFGKKALENYMDSVEADQEGE